VQGRQVKERRAMHLIGSPASPFLQRCAIVARAKGQDIAILPPPGGSLQSEEFLAISPMGRIPILALDDGSHLCESAAIASYLDEVIEGPSLRPGSALERARIREIEEITTHELAAAFRPVMVHRVFSQATDEAATIIAAADVQARRGCEALMRLMGETRFAAGDALTMADAVLVPILTLARIIAVVPEIGALLARYPFLGAYCDIAIGNSPVLARSAREMTETFALILARLKEPTPA
jgi:glutathione S-transferase